MNIHMLGIKGSGMSALAVILKQMGYSVRGSDFQYRSFTEEELLKNEIEILDFKSSNMENVDLLVVGHDFINSENIELLEARKRNIRIEEYHNYLSKVIEPYYSIAISGSNGKTTTTGMLANILNSVENTTYLIGNSQGQGNMNSRYFVFEACEYKEHFLVYKPNIILINNIDYDHVDYFLTREDYIRAFIKFAENSKEKVIVNGDDEILNGMQNVIVFGINNKKMFYADNIKYKDGTDYDLFYQNQKLGHIHLKGYGEYLVYDSLAAITCAICLGIEIKQITESISQFDSVKQRFKETIINDDVYIEDYAHHPSKIRAIINAVRLKYANKKIIAFYRPDRVSRLDYFSLEFKKELSKADEAYIVPYSNMDDIKQESLSKFVNKNKDIKLINEKRYRKVSLENGVVYLMMSSKDISDVKEKILKYKGD